MNPVEIRLMPDGPAKDQALELMRRRRLAHRSWVAEVPQPSARLLCGCPSDPPIGPSRIRDDSTCCSCSP